MIRLLKIIPIILFVILVNCDNEIDPPHADLSCSGRIAANDLEPIRTCIQKSWKIHYLKTGPSKTLLSNSYIDLKVNDSLYLILEGDLIAESLSTMFADADGIWVRFPTWQNIPLNLKVKDMSTDTLYLSDGAGDSFYALTPSPFVRNYNCGYSFIGKALNQIRSCIQGKWELKAAFGGYSGDDYVEYENCFVTFKPNDSIESIRNGSLYVRDKINWYNGDTQFGGNSFTIWFDSEGFPKGMFPFYIDENKLYLEMPADDGWGFLLVRTED
jgi:hypothetical protein